ncbi:SDR family NAD(P)-dependent oxidoreductase [Neptuniibacter sp. SY11_33]|uniref:SDR family NAD(P)-dependent oxidoreductase n=1 Tax=Neptuniibacter sp. SY11_33 TaxID=3398215 RepID=UPI0039F62623
MSNTTAVVTGGSKGIGLEIVSQFAEQGIHVIVCSRNCSQDLYDLIEQNAPEQIRWVEMDLLNEASVKKSAKDVVKSCEQIDVLVNCAGVAQGSAFLMTRLEEFKSVFDANYFNTLLFTQIIAKKMIRKKKGSIINIASTAGLLSDPGTLVYGGSKAALIHSTKVLATELGAFGIRVNAIAPAIVNTEMGKKNDEKAMELSDKRSALAGIIEPEEVAATVCFLASDNSSSKITGQVIRIDRGIH